MKKGQRHTAEAKAKIAASKVGRALGPQTPQHKENAAKPRRGLKRSDAQRQRISEALKGHRHSEETKAKIRAAQLAAWARKAEESTAELAIK